MNSRAEISINGDSLRVAQLSEGHVLILTNDHADQIQISLLVTRYTLQRWLMDLNDLELRQMVQEQQVHEAIVSPE